MSNGENKTQEIQNQVDATRELNKESDSYFQKLKNELDVLEEQNKRFDRRLKQEKERQENYKAEFNYQKSFISNEKQRLIFLQEQQSLLEEIEKLEKQKSVAMKLGTDALKEQEDQIEKLKSKLKLTEEQQKNINDLVDEQKDLVEDLVDLAEEHSDLTDSIATKIGLGNSELTKGVGKAIKFGKELMTSSKAIESLNRSILTTFSPQMIIGSLIESAIGLALALDKSGASLAATTGRGDEFNITIARATAQGRAMGVTYEKAAEAMGAFNKSLIGMGGAGDMDSLVKSAAQFGRLGVSADQVTKSLNILTTSGLGLTNDAAMESIKSMAMAGTEFGISSAQMIGDFVAASSQLQVHGRNTQKVFLGLEATARATGTEINDLIGIAGKFDTFQSAADTTGQLNAILGSTLSATKMLHMTEDERIATLIKTVNAQKGGFGAMDRFTRKAVMQAAGITDAAKAQQIFSGTSKQYLASQKALQAENAKSEEMQKKFEEAVSATIPIQEKFSESLKSLAENPDFINFIQQAMEFIVSLAQGIAKLQANTKGLAVPIMAFAGSLLYTFGNAKILAIAMKGVSKGVEEASESIPKITENVREASEEMPEIANNIGEGFANAISKVGEAIKGNAKHFIQFGFAMLLIGGAVAIAAFGVSQLVLSFKDFSAGEILAIAAALFVFGLTMVGMAFVLTKALPVVATASTGLLYFAGALVVLALGMVGAAYAFGMFVGYMTDLHKIGFDSIQIIGGLAVAIGLLGVAMVSSLFGMGGLLFVNPFAGIVRGLNEMADALDSLDDNKKILLTTTLDNLARITTGASAGITAGQVLQMTNVTPVEVNNTVTPKINLQATLLIDGEPIKVMAQDVTLGLD